MTSRIAKLLMVLALLFAGGLSAQDLTGTWQVSSGTRIPKTNCAPY